MTELTTHYVWDGTPRPVWTERSVNDGIVTILQESSVQDGRGPLPRSPFKKTKSENFVTKKLVL